MQSSTHFSNSKGHLELHILTKTISSLVVGFCHEGLFFGLAYVVYIQRDFLNIKIYIYGCIWRCSTIQ